MVYRKRGRSYKIIKKNQKGCIKLKLTTVSFQYELRGQKAVLAGHTDGLKIKVNIQMDRQSGV